MGVVHSLTFIFGLDFVFGGGGVVGERKTLALFFLVLLPLSVAPVRVVSYAICLQYALFSCQWHQRIVIATIRMYRRRLLTSLRFLP